MDAPEVKTEDWIKIGPNNIDGTVVDVFSPGYISAGYYQNSIKVVKEDLVWRDTRCEFKYTGPNGSYLTGRLEQLVKSGPSGT